VSDDQLALGKEFLRIQDSGGNIFDLLTDDVVVAYPKWGVARGKVELTRMYTDLAPYLRSTRHHPDSFRCLVGQDQVCISGLSSGSLVDGRTWEPDGGCAGRFCVWFTFSEKKISAVSVYIDPDYVDATADYYPWRR
jgi:hypothetical protein